MLAALRRVLPPVVALLALVPTGAAQTDLQVAFEATDPVHPMLGELQVPGEVWIPCTLVPTASGDPGNAILVSLEVTPHPLLTEAATDPPELRIPRVPECNLDAYTVSTFILRGRLHPWAPALVPSEVEVTARLDDHSGTGHAPFTPAYYAFLQMHSRPSALQADPGERIQVRIDADVQTNGPTLLELHIERAPTGWRAHVPAPEEVGLIEPLRRPGSIEHEIHATLEAPAQPAYAQSSDLLLVKGAAHHAKHPNHTGGIAVASIVASVTSSELVVQLADTPLPGPPLAAALAALAGAAMWSRRR